MRTRSEAGSSLADKRLFLYALLTLAALLGALFGALCWCYGSGRLSELLGSAKESYLSARRCGDVTRLLLGALTGMGTFLLAELLLSLSAVGQPFEVALPFLRGTVCGVILVSVNGGELNAPALLRTVAVFPGVLISLIITVLAAREAVCLSDRLFRICFAGEQSDGLFARIKLCGARFAVLTAAMSAGALVDCGLSMLVLSFGKA